MVEMDINRSRNDTFNLILSYGTSKAKEELKRSKKVKELSDKWIR